MPEDIGIGFEVYFGNGELYGTIVRESEYYWYINRAFKDKDDATPFLKSNFEDKYMKRMFMVKQVD